MAVRYPVERLAGEIVNRHAGEPLWSPRCAVGRVSVSSKSSRSEGMVRVDVDASANNLAAGNGDVVRADDAALPLAYGSDTLELMVRDPTWAHAYWDMSVERLTAGCRTLRSSGGVPAADWGSGRAPLG